LLAPVFAKARDSRAAATILVAYILQSLRRKWQACRGLKANKPELACVRWGVHHPQQRKVATHSLSCLPAAALRGSTDRQAAPPGSCHSPWSNSI